MELMEDYEFSPEYQATPGYSDAPGFETTPEVEATPEFYELVKAKDFFYLYIEGMWENLADDVGGQEHLDAVKMLKAFCILVDEWFIYLDQNERDIIKDQVLERLIVWFGGEVDEVPASSDMVSQSGTCDMDEDICAEEMVYDARTMDEKIAAQIALVEELVDRFGC